MEVERVVLWSEKCTKATEKNCKINSHFPKIRMLWKVIFLVHWSCFTISLFLRQLNLSTDSSQTKTVFRCSPVSKMPSELLLLFWGWGGCELSWMWEEEEEPSEVSKSSSELGWLHWLALSETTEMCWLFDVPWGHQHTLFIFFITVCTIYFFFVDWKVQIFQVIILLENSEVTRSD